MLSVYNKTNNRFLHGNLLERKRYHCFKTGMPLVTICSFVFFHFISTLNILNVVLLYVQFSLHSSKQKDVENSFEWSSACIFQVGGKSSQIWFWAFNSQLNAKNTNSRCPGIDLFFCWCQVVICEQNALSITSQFKSRSFYPRLSAVP